MSRPSGIVVNVADYCTVRIGFESRRRHGCWWKGKRGGRPLTPQSVLPLNWGGTEPNRTVNWMVFIATANDMRHLALCHDEFRGPRSGHCQSGGINNNNNNKKMDDYVCDSFIHVLLANKSSWETFGPLELFYLQCTL
ncbi:uncharacterized protein TNCV_2536941 [Trichonephila clavipes]|nr:uncharacterized protein TNCV_2536941 [Trichonephila clavipes]